MPLTPKQSGKKQRTTTRAKAIRTVNSPSIKTEHALSPAIHPPNPSEGQSTPPSSARRAFATTSDLVDLRARLEQAEALVARIPSQLLKPPILASTPSPLPDSQFDDLSDGEEEMTAVTTLTFLAVGEHAAHLSGMGTPEPKMDHASPEPAIHHPLHANFARIQSTIFLPTPRTSTSPPVTDFLRDISPPNALYQILQALPRRDIVDTLLEHWYWQGDWLDMTVSERDFRRETNDLWDHLDRGGDIQDVDTAWLAALYIRLAIVTRQMPRGYLAHEDPVIVAALPDQFYEASKKCLELAQWTQRPQFRVLQSLPMMIIYVWFLAKRNEGIVLLAGAVRIAQALGIDVLGEDQEIMPPWDDLAFPMGPSVLKRQLCCRVWAALQFVDNSLSAFDSSTRFFPIKGANTGLPLNLNDDDLHTTSLTAVIRPYDEFTDMTHFLSRNELITIWRFIESGQDHSMDDILAMDKKIRQVNARLPRLDSYGNILGTESKRRYSLIADTCVQSAISSQLLRLHSRDWLRSFKDPAKYAYARQTSLSAAATVIDVNIQAIRAGVGERCWFLHLQTSSTTMYLLLDLMHSIDSNAPNAKSVTEERFRQAESAIEIFRHVQETATVPTCYRIGQRGEATVVRAIMQAARERQLERANPHARLEKCTDIFKRITASFAVNA